MTLYHGSNEPFERGLATAEMLVRKMQFKDLTLQYSFHTPEALAALEFREAVHVH